jgi:hypothetical protein
MSTHVVLPVSANENKLRQKKISLHYGYTKSQVLTTFLLTKKNRLSDGRYLTIPDSLDSNNVAGHNDPWFLPLAHQGKGLSI